MASVAASSLSARVHMVGKSVQAKSSQKVAAKPMAVVCKAEAKAEIQSSRRGVVGAFTAAAMAATAKPSLAAYGEGANVFGKNKGPTDFIPFAGEGFAVLIPSKYNPSKEIDFPGTKTRWEDNGDAVNSMVVTVTPTSKGSITDYGSPEAFISEVAFMLGKATQTFVSDSEGGFGRNRVAAAAVLDTGSVEKKGKIYYEIEMLTRTADGDEGGRHHLFSATVSGGKLYVCKHTVGDKRWFKGADKGAIGSAKSFTVA